MITTQLFNGAIAIFQRGTVGFRFEKKRFYRVANFSFSTKQNKTIVFQNVRFSNDVEMYYGPVTSFVL